MDPYVVYYPRQGRNMCPSPEHGICSAPDSRYEIFRKNMGYALTYARKLNLEKALPQPDLSTTGYCLADTSLQGAEYLVYAPRGGRFEVDLSAMPASRKLAVEWLNPSTGESTVQEAISAGAHAQTFTPPFSGDAVLYLHDAALSAAAGN
jgi:hypothetical protein